ncbi:MerR family transcriptional regulator [Paenibacillus sp. CAU 1782]
MKVHEAAKALGVTPRALRFYEEKGLISPEKTHHNGYRSYDEENMEQLRWIVALRELGVPIAAIGGLLQSRQEPASFIRKLDETRSALYGELLRGMEELHLLEQTIAAWRGENKTTLEEAEQSAAMLRQKRSLRNDWSDQWNYDELARRHGALAPLAAHGDLLKADQYEYLLQRTLEWLDPRPGERGLDLGAGSGNFSALLIASGVTLTAVEQSSEMLALLSSRMMQVDARAGNLLALPLSSNMYDFAACTLSLQHLSLPQQLIALAEADRVLKTGGRLAIAGLFRAEPMSQANNKSPDQKSGALTPSSLAELKEWLENHGYSVVFDSMEAGSGILYGVKA